MGEEVLKPYNINDTFEYQIYIGCMDSQKRNEVVSKDELKDMVTSFLARKRIDFSMFEASGGYLYEDGTFEMEDTICINIIGNSETDIIGLARTLSMYMNQDYVLIIKDRIESVIR